MLLVEESKSMQSYSLNPTDTTRRFPTPNVQFQNIAIHFSEEQGMTNLRAMQSEIVLGWTATIENP